MNNILKKIKKNLSLTIKHTKQMILKNFITTGIFVVGLPFFVSNMDKSANFLEILSSSMYGLSLSLFILLIFNNINLLFFKTEKFLAIKKIKEQKIIENYKKNDINFRTNSNINKMKEQIKEHEKIR
jgi:hypothetical protein